MKKYFSFGFGIILLGTIILFLIQNHNFKQNDYQSKAEITCDCVLNKLPKRDEQRKLTKNVSLSSTKNDLSEILGDNCNIPANILDTLAIIDVEFLGFDSLIHNGLLIVNKGVINEVQQIFLLLLKERFPIEKIYPMTLYDWSDLNSMKDNNTSCFNYRNKVHGHSLSMHAYGLAIDINPMLNPYLNIKSGKITPDKATYDLSKKGTIHANSIVVKIFEQYGWHWGGYWKSNKDYQHFEKVIRSSSKKH